MRFDADRLLEPLAQNYFFTQFPGVPTSRVNHCQQRESLDNRNIIIFTQCIWRSRDQLPRTSGIIINRALFSFFPL